MNVTQRKMNPLVLAMLLALVVSILAFAADAALEMSRQLEHQSRAFEYSMRAEACELAKKTTDREFKTRLVSQCTGVPVEELQREQ